MEKKTQDNGKSAVKQLAEATQVNSPANEKAKAPATVTPQQKPTAPVPGTAPLAADERKIFEQKIAELEKKISQQPHDLKERIAYFQEKQKKINKLEKLETQCTDLRTHGEELKNIIKKDDFETDRYFLEVEAVAGYNNRETVFKMSNPVLIREVILYVIEKMNAKAEELRTEIAG